MNVLFATLEHPWPSSGGGRARTLAELRALARVPDVARITVLSVAEDEVTDRDRAALSAAIDAPASCRVDVRAPLPHPVHLFRSPRHVPRVVLLRALRGTPYVAGKWASRALRRALVDALEERPDVVVLDHLGMALYLPAIRRHAPDAAVLLDQHNVESDIFAQFAARKRGVLRVVARAEASAARRFEIDALRAVDAVIAISPDDRAAFRAMADVDAYLAPHTVDLAPRARTPSEDDPPKLGYVGNLSWHPNARGLERFVAEAWPRIRARYPAATLDVAGGGALRIPASWEAPGIRYLGFVDDLAPLFEACTAFVAPIEGGSGVRIKLLETLRRGMPTVTTPDGAAGLAVGDAREVLVADAGAPFATATLRVLGDAALRRDLAQRGLAYVREHHAPGVAVRALSDAIASARARRRRVPAIAPRRTR